MLGAFLFYSSLNSTITYPDISTETQREKIDSTSYSTSTITVLIGGDVMFDRDIRARGEKDGYEKLFAGIQNLFHSADISVVNLEGPITTYPSRTFLADGTYTKSFTFTFSPVIAKFIKNAGIDLVSLANNHTENFGRIGIDQTHTYLSQADVSWFGDPENLPTTGHVVCKQSICIAFVGYHEFSPGYENIIQDIQQLSHQGYPVIVVPHWGEEYSPIAPERIREKAKELISAGAFAIIGSHPHVIENKEWIEGIPVIYSLGNLIFDQYFSKEVMTGNIAELTISKNGDQTRLDRVRLYTVSNALKSGPIIVGEPKEFIRN